MSIVQNYYGLRPQISQNITIGEWERRQHLEHGVVVIGVSEHKTAASKALQQLPLKKDQAKLFRFYLQNCRPKVARGEPAANDPFFIGYKSKKKLRNTTRIVSKLQE